MTIRWLVGGIAGILLAIVFTGCATTGVSAQNESISHYKMALGRMQSGDDDAALYELNIAIQKDNSNRDAHFLAGIIYFKRQNYDQAINEYSKVTSLDPDFADAYNNTGLCYAKKKLYDKALDSFRAAADMPLNSNRINTLLNIGAVYDEMGNHEKSAEAYREVLLAMPSNASGMFNLASQYVKLGRKDDAIKYFRKLLDMYPGDAEAYLELGKIFYSQGDNQQSSVNLNKVIEIAPGSRFAESAKEFLDLMK